MHPARVGTGKLQNLQNAPKSNNLKQQIVKEYSQTCV